MQGRGHKGCAGEGVPHPQYLACRHIRQISTVFVNVVLLIKLKGSPICRQIGLERSLFIGILGLCTPLTICLAFAPVVLYLVEEHTRAGNLCMKWMASQFV